MPDSSDGPVSWTGHLRQRLAGLRLNPGREAEIIEELWQHLDARYEELTDAGVGRDEAQRVALAELCEPDTLAQSCPRRTPQPSPWPRSFSWRSRWSRARFRHGGP